MEAYGYQWHQTTVGRIEAAQRPLRLNEVVDMCRLFDVTIGQLMGPDPGLTLSQIDAQIEERSQQYAELIATFGDFQAQEGEASLRLDRIRRNLKAAEATALSMRAEIEALNDLRAQVSGEADG